MYILDASSQPTESEPVEMEPVNLCFTSPLHDSDICSSLENTGLEDWLISQELEKGRHISLGLGLTKAL